MIDNPPLQLITPLTNANNLFATGRRPVSALEEPVIIMTTYEIEAMLRKENGKASVPLIC